MDMNYLVQRKINAQKKYRRKVILTITCSVILLVLFIVGLIKVIVDDKSAEENNKGTGTNVAENLTPGANNETASGEDGTTGESDGSQSQTEVNGTEVTLVPTVTTAPTETPVPTKAPSKKIAVDAGHGGEDLGSTRKGLYEKDANLAIALYLQDLLEDAGYEVYMVRDTDVELELEQRPVMAKESGADIYVSIHLNSLDGDSDATQGAEVWYSNLRDDNSDTLAQYVVDEVTAATGTRNRGIKLSNGLIVLKYNELPACLLECGFITSEPERAKLFDPEYQQKIAEGVANGIKKFLPLE